MKIAKKPRIQSIGVFRRRRPDHIVAIQQKNCVPVGMAIMMLAAVKKLSPSCGRPVANMWWTHRPNPMNAVDDERQHDRQVAEHRPPRERGDDRRDDAGARDEDDVDLGMAEEPEQVLPQQRVAAVLDVEEVGADEPIEDEAVLASITAGMAKSTMNDVTTCAHTKIGIRFSVIPGARSLNTVVISDDRDRERGDLGEGDQLRPDVGAFAGV